MLAHQGRGNDSHDWRAHLLIREGRGYVWGESVLAHLGGRGWVGRGRECIMGESVVAYQGGGEWRGRECIGGGACWPIRGRGCDRRAFLLIWGGCRERIGEESLMAHQGEGGDISGIFKPRNKVL